MSVIDGTSANDTITPDLITKGVVGTPSAFPDDGSDELHGHAGNDYLAAGGGEDFIFGDDLQSERGNDTLDGGAGADHLYGANGNDVYVVDDAGDEVIESVAGTAGGVDRVQSSVISINLLHYDNGFGLENATLLGTRALNINGSAANNVLTGNVAANTILGGFGNDSLNGGSGNDMLDGQQDNDVLHGQGGNDTLVGSPGVDVLIGGTGRDVFHFGALGASAAGAMDQISSGDGAVAFEGAGAAAGDKIDLAKLDANSGVSGNQTFVFGGTGAGHVSVVDSGTDTIVRANVDGDATFELQFVIHDGSVHASAYTAADFIL